MTTSLCVRDAIEGLLPSPRGVHRRSRAVATSGLTSAISSLTGNSRPAAPYGPQGARLSSCLTSS